MISQELYNKEMSKAILFTGHNLKTAAVQVIYDEVRANYTNKDFMHAISDIMELEVYRLNGQSLIKRLNFHRALRVEREESDRKEKERAQAAELWDMDSKLREVCTAHKCFSCQRLHIRCNDIAKATIEGMKASLNGLVSRENMMATLAKEFPGAGFEKEWKLGRERVGVTEEELRSGKLEDLNRAKLTVAQKQEKLEAEYYKDDDLFPKEQI